MASGIYYVNAETDANAVGAGVRLQIWNPSSTRTIALLELILATSTTAGVTGNLVMRRSTARGTAASTITPGAAQHARNAAAPDSGFVIDLGAFSVEPTLATETLPPVWRLQGASAGSGGMNMFPRGIEIPPGTGLCLRSSSADLAGLEVGMTIEEL